MRILIVEDDHKIAKALQTGLTRQSYAVDVCFDGDDGNAMAISQSYDLVILDRMIPGEFDGLGILKNMRSHKIHTPVLFLTAKDRVLDKVEGINAGADDYLVKPFAYVELLARVRALLRRPQEAFSDDITYSDIEIDTLQKTVKRAGEIVEVSALEFSLLEYFMRNEGKTLSKEQIIEHVWNFDADVLPNTVEVYVGYLRAKLEKPFKKSPKVFHTRRGFGYVFGEEA